MGARWGGECEARLLERAGKEWRVWVCARQSMEGSERGAGLVEGGGKVFVCGSSRVAEGVGGVLKRCWIEGKPEERDEQGAEEWWAGVRNERFASDVFD